MPDLPKSLGGVIAPHWCCFWLWSLLPWNEPAAGNYSRSWCRWRERWPNYSLQWNVL